jgi:hypothetical protein
MKSRWPIFAIAGVLLAVMVGSWGLYGRAGSADRILLLLPDGTSFSDPKVTVWLDAGSEEGLHIVPVHDSDFVRPLFPVTKCAGVILPDSIHKQAGDVFLVALHRFIAGGGKLMLVYDAATLSLQGRYAAGSSRLSDLAGVNYALYDALHDNSIQWGTVTGKREVVQQMDIPPGKYYPFGSAGSGEEHPTDMQGPKYLSEVELRRYKFGDLKYPSFVTSGDYSGNAILHSGAGLVAGERPYEKGSVLFVNLPLGYLKSNTDGLLLHVFLKHFAEQTLSEPYLMSVPDGVGGLVLNWHVDSNAAIKPLQQLESWSLFKQGPYSIHITAGPDAGSFGDRKGFNIDHNPISQQLVHEYSGLGDQIGSHGGWIHDYFSVHVDKDNPKDLEQFLSLNKEALERATGKPVQEYSAPSGNQPVWVTHWLEAHGFLAYYFTGDTGMGPTQGYRNGVREGRDIWAFPIAHLDRAAAFEEMGTLGYTNAEVGQWLESLTTFAASHDTVRLVYFHPPGILDYHEVIDHWMEQTARLKEKGQFRWYTMTSLATFLNERKRVNWKSSEENGVVTVEAGHPGTLEHMAWRFSADRFSEPVVLQGSAHVLRDENGWKVIAGPGKILQFQTKVVSK